MNKAKTTLLLVYDGACPMCSTFSKLVQIRQTVGYLELINARNPHPILVEINQHGFNLDNGIVIKYHQNFYSGAEALQLLALLSSQHSWFNRINAFIFRSKYSANIIYPILRTIRNGLLKFKGVTKINNLSKTYDK